MVRICASIVAENRNDVLSLAEKAVKEGIDLVEIRADALENQSFGNIKKLIEKTNEIIKRSGSKIEVILTLRKKEEGGSFRGSEDERIEVIEKLLESADFDYIDIELSCGERVLKKIVEKAKKNEKKVIISYHDFEKTPSKDYLLWIMKKELAFGADVAKIAVKASNEKDVLNLLEACIDAKETDAKFCMISMGEAGKITRFIAPFFGSEITYGYIEGREKAAPGQISVQKLKMIFDTMLYEKT